MLDAVALQEQGKLFANELWSVVTDQLLWKTMACEQDSEMLDGLGGGGGGHGDHFRPLGIGVNHN